MMLVHPGFWGHHRVSKGRSLVQLPWNLECEAMYQVLVIWTVCIVGTLSFTTNFPQNGARVATHLVVNSCLATKNQRIGRRRRLVDGRS